MSKKLTFEQNKEKYLGNIFKTNSCGYLKVIEYNNAKDVLVQFLDTGYVGKTESHTISIGEVKDRLSTTAHGVGVLGISGEYCKDTYSIWNRMLRRCYSKDNTTSSPYYGCEVSDFFKNYSYFNAWCSEQTGCLSKDQDGKIFALDKDILGRGTKLYSPSTCCFVPQEINSLQFNHNTRVNGLPTGVHYDTRTHRYVAQIGSREDYKFLGRHLLLEDAISIRDKEKKMVLKNVAEKYKGEIEDRVYDALCNWEVVVW